MSTLYKKRTMMVLTLLHSKLFKQKNKLIGLNVSKKMTHILYNMLHLMVVRILDIQEVILLIAQTESNKLLDFTTRIRKDRSQE